ncbi:MAG: succinate--CoA ligase subunit alpha, partial [Candidatus Bipolaricaulia bacterium]
MSILIDERTRLLIQGITGGEGSFHARRMIEYGTKVVAGVTPGKGGQALDSVPIYDTVAEAMAHTRPKPNVSAIFVPAPFAPDAIIEAADAGIKLIVCITERIPMQAALRVYHMLKLRKTRLIGPNCPGVISPGKAKVGIMPGEVFRPGPVGIVSRSGTLTYEIAAQLSRAGLGQSTVVGIGGDPVVGSSFIDILELFEKDPETKLVVLVGEIGGRDEEEAAEFIAKEMTKPVIAYIAGFSAPPGKRMGHAGAIISGGEGTAQSKKEALEAKGIPVGRTPREMVELAKRA